MVRSVCLLIGLGVVGAAAGSPGRQAPEPEARQAQSAALLIDTHNDVTSRTVRGFDIGKEAGSGHTDLARLREGGVQIS